MCRKGRCNQENQINSFVIVDGDFKIFGMFDGHGVDGNLASGFAAGKMLNYIRNVDHNFFNKNYLQ
jgi:serine/threonine protein phosphatase PrpC